MSQPTPSRNFAFGFLGSAMGLIWSIVFLALYYGQEFSTPVPDEFRIKSAALITTVFFVIILIVVFHRSILTTLNDIFSREDAD